MSVRGVRSLDTTLASTLSQCGLTNVNVLENFLRKSVNRGNDENGCLQTKDPNKSPGQSQDTQDKTRQRDRTEDKTTLTERIERTNKERTKSSERMVVEVVVQARGRGRWGRIGGRGYRRRM